MFTQHKMELKLETSPKLKNKYKLAIRNTTAS